MSWRSSGGIKRWAADKWFSQCVRLRADHICEHCRMKEGTDCAHIVGRAVFATRWCGLNAVCLCRHCHDMFGSQPLLFTDWLNSVDPKRSDLLMVKQRGTLKNNESTRKLISDHYRKEFRRMESTGEKEFESWN